MVSLLFRRVQLTDCVMFAANAVYSVLAVVCRQLTPSPSPHRSTFWDVLFPQNLLRLTKRPCPEAYDDQILSRVRLHGPWAVCTRRRAQVKRERNVVVLLHCVTRLRLKMYRNSRGVLVVGRRCSCEKNMSISRFDGVARLKLSK